MEEPTQAHSADAVLSDAFGIHEVLPKKGIIYSERDSFQSVLCKPKIMPLKSAVLEKLEKIETDAH